MGEREGDLVNHESFFLVSFSVFSDVAHFVRVYVTNPDSHFDTTVSHCCPLLFTFGHWSYCRVTLELPLLSDKHIICCRESKVGHLLLFKASEGRSKTTLKLLLRVSISSLLCLILLYSLSHLSLVSTTHRGDTQVEHSKWGLNTRNNYGAKAMWGMPVVMRIDYLLLHN